MRLHVGCVSGACSALSLLLLSSPVTAQDSYSDPAGSGALVSAANWLQGTLLGTAATVVAVIAVATVGFMMLTGRINWRYGATVILGCFILFGAPLIANGILGAVSGQGSEAVSAPPALPPPPPIASLPPAKSAPSTPYDPYAGAALPPR